MRRSSFSFEDVLEEFSEAAGAGRGEYLDPAQYSFRRANKALPPNLRFKTELEYQAWLKYHRDYKRRWRKSPRVKALMAMQFKAWRATHPNYAAWRHAQYLKWVARPGNMQSAVAKVKAWRAANPEKARAQSRRKWKRIKADPSKLVKKRAANRRHQRARRERLKQKRGSPGQAVNGGR